MALTTFGEVLVGFAVVRVHWRVMKEHKIDRAVLQTMKRERVWAIAGILFIIVGFVVELIHILF